MSTEKLGQCCYGIQRTKAACGDCAAWTPLQAQVAPKVGPLTDRQAIDLIEQIFVTGENLKHDRDVLFRSKGTPSNVWGMDLVWLVRAVEAAHGINAPKEQQHG